MASLRDQVPEDRQPSWKRKTVSSTWDPETAWQKTRPYEDAQPSVDQVSSTVTKIFRGGRSIFLITIILTGVTLIWIIGNVEREYRLATQSEVSAIVKRTEAERDFWKQKYEEAQKTWQKDKSSLEDAVNSARKARSAAESRAEELARENEILRQRRSP